MNMIKIGLSVFDLRYYNMVNFPHMDSNIPSKSAYGVYISQLVRIGRICDNYEFFHKTPPADL